MKNLQALQRREGDEEEEEGVERRDRGNEREERSATVLNGLVLGAEVTKNHEFSFLDFFSPQSLSSSSRMAGFL